MKECGVPNATCMKSHQEKIGSPRIVRRSVRKKETTQEREDRHTWPLKLTKENKEELVQLNQDEIEKMRSFYIILDKPKSPFGKFPFAVGLNVRFYMKYWILNSAGSDHMHPHLKLSPTSP